VPQHSETRTLPYSAEQMFDLVADVERYPDFLPWCTGMRIVKRDEKNIVAIMIVGTKLLHEKFTSHVMLDRPKAIRVRYVAGPLSHLTNTWEFKPKGPKSCEVSFDLNFDFRSPLFRAAMTSFFDHALAKMVAAFEARAAALYK